MRRSFLAAAAALALLPGLAAAQATSTGSGPYPNRPIRLLVPYPAGGTTDLMARALQEPLQRALGQPLVIENKPGASGVLAAREVARGRPDGYTLFFINSGNVAVTPFVVKDAGFDGVKDFAPVALVSAAPLFFVVNGEVPARDVKGFIDWARSQPQPVPYASAGIGSFGHLSSELFAKTAGVKLQHIPYKGQAPTTNAVVAGEVKLLITTASSAMNDFIANGRLRLLGVTSAEPSPLAPNAPTVGATVPGYAAETWFGVITTAGTPPDIVNRLNAALNAALETPDMQQRFRGFGVQVRTTTPQKLGELIVQDVARWAPVIRENNIQSE
jgi:tripartite-type tricarboxylate transporter receptor subunit TctC